MTKPVFILMTPEEIESIIQATAEKMISLLPPPPNQVTTSATEYITRAEAARRLKISYPTLWKITKEGKIDSFKIGTKVLYRPQDIDNLACKINLQSKFPQR